MVSDGHERFFWTVNPYMALCFNIKDVAGGSIPAATKIVRCKNLAFNIGECVSRGLETT